MSLSEAPAAVRTPAHQPIEVGSKRSLIPSHESHLAESGITSEVAAANGIYTEHDRKKLADLVGWKGWPAKMGVGLVFPFTNSDGAEVFSRVKPEKPPERNGKPLKYLQPKGVSTRCYFPAGVRDDLAAGTVRLLITEGEKKAISATAAGFPTIGLTGVNAWCRPKSVALNADMSAISWQGRTVYVVFDSDAVENANVAAEEQKLSMALAREGAIVNVVRLPGDGDAKVGLDDFLVANGPGALERLIETAMPADEPDPVSLKGEAKDADPAIESAMFAENCGLGNQPRIRFYQGTWWYWERGAYRELADCDLRAKIIEHYARRYTMVKGSHASDCLEHLRSQTLVASHLDTPAWLYPHDADDPDPSECIAFRNGTLHIPSFVAGNAELLPSTPRFFTTCRADFKFSPNPPEPSRWLAFLDSVLGDDTQSKELLQDWFGYCLTPDTRQQKALFVVGPKRSGKGTIARVLTALLGRTNVAAPTLGSLGERFGLQPLVGKPLAIVHDARLSGRSDQAPIVERLLSVTGEDHQTIDRKHRDPVTVKLPTRFAIMSNELPRLTDSSGALVGRLLLLETPTSFYGREDHSLTGDLLGELPGIFGWAAEGWQRLQDRGRFEQPSRALERLQDLADLSSPVGEFLRDRCVVDGETLTKTNHVYSAWQSWCLAKGMKATGDNIFGRDLLAAAPKVDRRRAREGDGRAYFYVGLRLLAGSEW